MEKLDFEVIDDLQAQMSRCAALSLQFVSHVSELGNVDNPECREILKRIMCTMIMEGDTQRVLDFISVPIRFVLGTEADKVLADTRKVLDGMEISTEDRLIGAFRGSRL